MSGGGWPHGQRRRSIACRAMSQKKEDYNSPPLPRFERNRRVNAITYDPRASPFVADSSRNCCAPSHNSEGRLRNDRAWTVAWRHADRQTCARTLHRPARLPRPQPRAVATGVQAMSVKLRKYQGGDEWEVDIRVQLPMAPSCENGRKRRSREERPCCAGPRHASECSW